jgi:outer membrane autotransporter protein
MCPPQVLVAIGILAGLVAPSLRAQQSAPTGSLVNLVNSGRYGFNRLERLSAYANQATFNALDPLCNPAPQAPPPPVSACSALTRVTYENVRELVQTANELLSSGPTQYSLRTDEEGLGFALRWTAAEELSAPGTASSEFANTQIASVLSRITALRYGASGFTVANAKDSEALGAGAASESLDSRLGGFLNGAYGYGQRDPSEVEDAFAFDNRDLTLGVDYRFTSAFVLGFMVGHTQQAIDFDSTQSVVDGEIDSEGFSGTLYALYDWDGPYASMALAWQRLAIDIRRDIIYPSFNEDTESVYATARGETDSQTLTATLDLGWAFTAGAFGFDPYLRGEYRDIAIDSFKETSIDNLTGGPGGFDFAVGEQSLSSLDGTFGIKLQYTFTPSFGIVVPYVKGELHRNFDTDPFTVSATYNGQGNSSNPFDLPSDVRDKSFQVFAAGASLVLRRGWQAFAQYQRTEGLDLLEQQIISGGIRGEF